MAKIIQCAYRRHVAKLLYNERKSYMNKIITIQRTYRGYCGRKISKQLIRKREENKAWAKIRSEWMSHKYRKLIKEIKNVL